MWVLLKPEIRGIGRETIVGWAIKYAKGRPSKIVPPMGIGLGSPASFMKTKSLNRHAKTALFIKFS